MSLGVRAEREWLTRTGDWLTAESYQLPAVSQDKGLDLGDVACLRALGAVDDLELHCLAFLERSETVALNGRVVHEDVTTSVALDEPVALGVVEPFDLACDTHRSIPTCCDARERVIKPAPDPVVDVPEQKKRPLCAAFPFRRQARPASAEIILDFRVYAKSSLAE